VKDISLFQEEHYPLNKQALLIIIEIYNNVSSLQFLFKIRFFSDVTWWKAWRKLHIKGKATCLTE